MSEKYIPVDESQRLYRGPKLWNDPFVETIYRGYLTGHLSDANPHFTDPDTSSGMGQNFLIHPPTMEGLEAADYPVLVLKLDQVLGFQLKDLLNVQKD